MSIVRIFLLVFGFAVYMGLIFLSRSMQNRAFSNITQDEKDKIFSSFSLFRKYNLVPAAVLLLLYIVFIKLFPQIPYRITNALFGGAYIFYLVFTLIFIYFKMRTLGVEKKIVSKIVVALSLQYFGMVVTLACLVGYFFIPMAFSVS